MIEREAAELAGQDSGSATETLTRREQEVLNQLLCGCTTVDIAAALH
jgi:DNA-binding NarL/FixJ family response regulator